MTSISIPASRMALSLTRLQYPRPAIAAWRIGRRYQTTTADITTGTPEPLAVSLLTQFPDGPPRPPAAANPSVSTSKPKQSKEDNQTLIGKVTSAGLMSKTVRVDRPVQEWHNYLRKFHKSSKHYLVHDPANSLRTGDMISFSRIPVPKGQSVSHVVREILVPFGQDIQERPPIPTFDDLRAKVEQDKAAKRERRELRRKAEDGDEEAARRVKAEGIAVKEVAKGTGRGRKVKRLLERDA